MYNIFHKGRQGVRICQALGLKYDAKISLHIDDITQQVGGVRKEVKDLCERLAKEGFLTRDKDAARSYRLALPPEMIKLGDIIKICEYDLYLTDCVIAKQCPVNADCFYDKLFWNGLQQNLFILANQVTLQMYLDNMIQMSYVAPEICPLSQLNQD